MSLPFKLILTLTLILIFAIRTEAIALFEQEGNRASAQVAFEEGNKLFLEGTPASIHKALEKYNESLSFWRAVGERKEEAAALINIGFVYSSLGDNQTALEYYLQALPIAHASGEASLESKTLSNIGLAYKSIGEFRKSLDYYGQAEMLTSRQDRRENAELSFKIGELYEAINQITKAIDHYSRAISLYVAENDRLAIAKVFNKVGIAYFKKGNFQNALICSEHALSLFKSAGERREEANLLCNIGTFYRLSGDGKTALDYYNQALKIRKSLNDRRGEATILNNIGFVQHFLFRDGKKAVDYFSEALPLLRAIGDRSGETASLYGISIAERDLDNLQKARNRIEEALNIIEITRGKVFGQELYNSYFITKQQLYEFYIALLMRLHKSNPSDGNAIAALNATERARSQRLIELLDMADADINHGADPKLLEKARFLYHKLNDKSDYQLKLFSGKSNEEQIKETANEIDQLTTEYKKLQIIENSPYYAFQPQSQFAAANQIQKEISDGETLFLDYSLGKDRSFLWVLTSSSVESFELPGRDEIEDAARKIYKLMTEHSEEEPKISNNYETAKTQRVSQKKAEAEYKKAAADLSRIILGPIAGLLGKKRLLIVSDGALQYVPFGALPAPNSSYAQFLPLLAEHEIVNLPSALLTLKNSISGHKPADGSVLAIGDPVLNEKDERIKADFKKQLKAVDKTMIGNIRDLALEEAAPFINEKDHDMGCESCGTLDMFFDIERLPETRSEIGKILDFIPPSKRKAAFDFAAKTEIIQADELSRYSVIHFASYGFFNNAHPELSGILFSLFNEQGEQQKGFLPLSEIFNLNLSADLVVLSSCRTGLNREIKDGPSELISGFLHAGAARVAANLWRENAKAKEEIMIRFYRGMFGPKKLNPAAALRAAQLSMRREKSWHQPWYWAAFVLYGKY